MIWLVSPFLTEARSHSKYQAHAETVSILVLMLGIPAHAHSSSRRTTAENRTELVGEHF